MNELELEILNLLVEFDYKKLWLLSGVAFSHSFPCFQHILHLFSLINLWIIWLRQPVKTGLLTVVRPFLLYVSLKAFSSSKLFSLLNSLLVKKKAKVLALSCQKTSKTLNYTKYFQTRSQSCCGFRNRREYLWKEPFQA